MADISGIGADQGPARLEHPTRQRPDQPGRENDSPAIRRGSDEVEVSRLSVMLQRLRDVPGIREDLVAQLRREIEAGVYDEETRLDAALDAMIQEISEQRG